MKEFNLDVKQAMAEVLLGKTVEDFYRTRHYLEGDSLVTEFVGKEYDPKYSIENVLFAHKDYKFRIFVPDDEPGDIYSEVYHVVKRFIKESYDHGYESHSENNGLTHECALKVIDKLQELGVIQ